MSWDRQDEDQGWQQQVNDELEHNICAALDHFQDKGADLDQLRLIAWHCSVQWTPKQYSRHN